MQTISRIPQRVESREERRWADRGLKLSVIIPVHNGGESMVQALRALAASHRHPDEVIVVDDGSTDDSTSRARSFGARVVRLPDGPHGPAAARNRGAGVATGELLLFLDADVAVHPDTLARIEMQMAGHPEVAALFGSYDTTPAARTPVSLYKNLLHHYVHQKSSREASTFWSGCGAIRRDDFIALGGFKESFGRPSIEDIELGSRLRQSGRRVWLCGEVQVTHLKRWDLLSLLKVDIFDRAIPWTRLIVRNTQLPKELNLDIRSRFSAAAVLAAPACLGLCIWSAWALLGLAMALGLLWALNAGLYRFFVRQGGVRFAGAAVPLHALYLLYSSLTFILVAGPAWISGASGKCEALSGESLKDLGTPQTPPEGASSSLWTPPWRTANSARHLALRLISLLLFAGGWEALAPHINGLLFPSFSETIVALGQLVGSPAFWSALWLSNQALLIGFLLAAGLGICLGLWMGRSPTVERIAAPYLSTLLVTPVSALVPLFIIATGLGLVTRVIIVFTFDFAVITVTTRGAVRSLDPIWLEMATSFGANERQLWRRILLPGLWPALLTALRLGLGRALSGMVAAELLVVAVGLGRLILEYQGNFDTAPMFATVLCVVIQAVALTEGAKYLEVRLCPWRAVMEDR